MGDGWLDKFINFFFVVGDEEICFFFGFKEIRLVFDLDLFFIMLLELLFLLVCAWLESFEILRTRLGVVNWSSGLERVVIDILLFLYRVFFVLRGRLVYVSAVEFSLFRGSLVLEWLFLLEGWLLLIEGVWFVVMGIRLLCFNLLFRMNWLDGLMFL